MLDPELETAWGPLLRAAGEGLLDCQRLEYGLGVLLLSLGRRGVCRIDVERMRAILDGEIPSGAGKLRKQLAGNLELSPEEDAVLAEGIRSRNRLIHRFLIENAGRVMDASQREEVASELRDLRLKVQAAEHLLHPVVDQLSVQLDGVSLADYEELARRVLHGLQNDPWGRRTRG